MLFSEAVATESHRLLEKQLPNALAQILGAPADVKVPGRRGRRSGHDLLVSSGGHSFVVEIEANGSPGQVAALAQAASERAHAHGKRSIPLVAVPFMSEVGRRACEAAQVSWMDLSGNAHIVAPGLRVIIDGRPNLFKNPGRPSNVFSPKSARVVRWLLMDPARSVTQREIARATDMTEGFVSRIVARLEADGYVARVGVNGEGDGFGGGFGYGSAPGAANGDGTGGSYRSRPPVRVRDASLLLEAWREAYQFSKHTIIQGHVAARSGDALAHKVSDALAHANVTHAATGLAAAWQMTHFAGYRIATFFLEDEPSDELKAQLGFREDVRGANLWLVVPNDVGVFHGAEDRDGIRCVHPVQAYLDLKAHPERATEAADRLRAELLEKREP